MLIYRFLFENLTWVLLQVFGLVFEPVRESISELVRKESVFCPSNNNKITMNLGIDSLIYNKWGPSEGWRHCEDYETIQEIFQEWTPKTKRYCKHMLGCLTCPENGICTEDGKLTCQLGFIKKRDICIPNTIVINHAINDLKALRKTLSR